MQPEEDQGKNRQRQMDEGEDKEQGLAHSLIAQKTHGRRFDKDGYIVQYLCRCHGNGLPFLIPDHPVPHNPFDCKDYQDDHPGNPGDTPVEAISIIINSLIRWSSATAIKPSAA